jgi:hypothetical protein
VRASSLPHPLSSRLPCGGMLWHYARSAQPSLPSSCCDVTVAMQHRSCNRRVGAAAWSCLFQAKFGGSELLTNNIATTLITHSRPHAKLPLTTTSYKPHSNIFPTTTSYLPQSHRTAPTSNTTTIALHPPPTPPQSLCTHPQLQCVCSALGTATWTLPSRPSLRGTSTVGTTA